MDFHNVANIFPLMEGKEFQDLVEDIRINGLMEPINTFEGKIIDGRNRYRACLEAGVKPRFIEFDGSVPLITFIVSLNLHRRHLDEGQRGMVAARIKPMFEAEAKKRQAHGQTAPGKTLSANLQKPIHAAQEAADLLNVSPRTVEHASKVIKTGIAELVREVDAGNVAVSKASQIAALPPDEQAEVLSKPHVAHNSGDNEWYTPLEIIESARTVLGHFDLDPASSPEANGIVKAKTFYDEAMDGLSLPWSGYVWMNPPYASSLIGKFTEKLLGHISEGSVVSAIVLVNNATETRWFQGLLSNAEAVCFPAGRVKFWHPRKVAAPLQGQAIIYFGISDREFEEEFSKYGVVCTV